MVQRNRPSLGSVDWRRVAGEDAVADDYGAVGDINPAPVRFGICKAVGDGQSGDVDRPGTRLQEKYVIFAVAGDGERARARSGDGQASADHGQ